jgi:hypothetical protein
VDLSSKEIILACPIIDRNQPYIYLLQLTEQEVLAMEKNAIDMIAMILVIVGGLNWGLVGLFGFDLVAFLLGALPLIQNLVYAIVGVSAAYMIYYAAKT